jgi:hypothetical protein
MGAEQEAGADPLIIIPMKDIALQRRIDRISDKIPVLISVILRLRISQLPGPGIGNLVHQPVADYLEDPKEACQEGEAKKSFHYAPPYFYV